MIKSFVLHWTQTFVVLRESIICCVGDFIVVHKEEGQSVLHPRSADRTAHPCCHLFAGLDVWLFIEIDRMLQQKRERERERKLNNYHVADGFMDSQGK